MPQRLGMTTLTAVFAMTPQVWAAGVLARTDLLGHASQLIGQGTVHRGTDGQVRHNPTGASRVRSSATNLLLTTSVRSVNAGDQTPVRLPDLRVGLALDAYKTVLVWCSGISLPVGGGTLSFYRR